MTEQHLVTIQVPGPPASFATAREKSRKDAVRSAAAAAGHTTTMRYDRARQNLDRHPNYILAADIALRHLTEHASPAA
jgi:hypothetical protein